LELKLELCAFFCLLTGPCSNFRFLCIQRLAAGEWFTARVSACGLFHIAYPSAPELLKAELRSIYGQLCQDDMPMVRRSAATNLGKYAATVESPHLKTDIMSFFEDLTHDGIIFSYNTPRQ
jgi:serine/threonine-protein phosphatase 2A regulatory subunit A